MSKTLIEEYPDDLKEIRKISVGTIFRDWFEDGVRVLVMRGPYHPCVYFGIPLDHPLANKHYDDLPVDCHGGLTFSGKGDGKYWPKEYFWYGYDYGHCDDYTFSDYRDVLGKMWSIKEIVSDSWCALNDFKKLMRLAENIAVKP